MSSSTLPLSTLSNPTFKKSSASISEPILNMLLLSITEFQWAQKVPSILLHRLNHTYMSLSTLLDTFLSQFLSNLLMLERTAVKSLLYRWIIKFGPPIYLVTDSGSEYDTLLPNTTSFAPSCRNFMRFSDSIQKDIPKPTKHANSDSTLFNSDGSFLMKISLSSYQSKLLIPSSNSNYTSFNPLSKDNARMIQNDNSPFKQKNDQTNPPITTSISKPIY